MTLIADLKDRAHRLRRDAFALYLVARHPDTPLAAKVIAAAVAAYAFSPIDLIPDAIPVLGYVDDLVLVPLGIALALRMVPSAVLDECRPKAAEALGDGAPIAGGCDLDRVGWVLVSVPRSRGFRVLL
jgi:uncharacterized membrane protein YkvA (DUF1232 family)